MKRQLLLKVPVLFLMIFFLGTKIMAQRLDSLLSETEIKYSQEKIYIHYDRPYYNPGETIWFKMYLAGPNFPYFISSTAYAELLNDKGVLLQRKILPVLAYGASSSFDIPDSIAGTQLYIRAYTAWMLNFDSTLQYFKPVSIIHKITVKSKPAEVSLVNFFPEAGDMVVNVPSRVSFKATNGDGEPIPVNGNITDETGKIITPFASSHDGMGSFNLTAIDGEHYKAVWKDKKNKSHETLLPDAKKDGVGLSVSIQGSIKYTLERPSEVTDDFKTLYVIAQMQQTLVYSARINMAAKTKVTAPLPADSLPDGILQLTIFNARQLPVAQRLIFINHGNYFFNTDLHAIELNLGKRRKNILQVDVGDTILTNLSVSVTDENLSQPGRNRDNIFSHLLLTSDLRGNVYNPAQYFASDEDSVKQQLDLVMLTNGWRRFKWEDIIAGKFPAIRYFPEKNLSISGMVYGPSKLVLKDKSINAVIKTKSNGSEFLLMPVNQDGSFKIDDMLFFDTARLFYQFNADKDKKLTNISSFNFNSPYQREAKINAGLLNDLYPAMRPDSITEKRNRLFAERERGQFYQGNRIKELGTVVVKTRVKTPQQKIDEEYTSGFFSGGDGYTFITEGDPFAKSALTVLDYLKSKVAGLQVSTDGEPSISWRGSATALFLNETPSEVSAIQTIPMTDVAMVKVFRPPFFGASGGGAGGAVAVYMKKGFDASANVKGLDFVNLAGYSAIKSFYSPDYEQQADINNAEDLRSTLYWNPSLIMDKNNRRLKLAFFNTDQCTSIRVIIEGVNRLGQFTHEEKVFTKQ